MLKKAIKFNPDQTFPEIICDYFVCTCFHRWSNLVFDHEIISMVILLPSRVIVSRRKYVHKVLVNCLVKLAQEKSVV